MTDKYSSFFEELAKPTTPTKKSENDKQIYNPIARQQEAEQQQRAVHQAHQEAILKAGQLRDKITKGVQEAKEPLFLLLQAIECISLITGDNLYLEQNEANLIAIYGIGLQHTAPLKLELEQVTGRLTMLNRSQLTQTETTETLQRIKTAIKAHERRQAELIELIANSKLIS